MASGWPFSTPRAWDLSYRTNSLPIVRTLIQTGTVYLGGIRIPNNSDADALVTFTDGSNQIVWHAKVNAHSTEPSPGDLEDCNDLYVVCDRANIPAHVWGWKT